MARPVTSAAPGDAATIGRILGAGFEDDPVLSWVFEDPGRRQKLEAMFTFLAAEPEWTWHLGDGAAAGWLPPGGVDRAEGDRFVEAMPLATPADLGRLLAMGEAMAAAHPQEPHWYLAAIAADPARRSQGLGSAVLSHGLVEVDLSGMPAYLESSNPRNITLYQRHGFEVTGRIDIDDGVFMTPMWRP